MCIRDSIGTPGIGGFKGVIGKGTNKRKSKDYGIWEAMIRRCYLETDSNYKNYGAVGITVTEEWHDFQSYAAWYSVNCMQEDLLIDKDLLHAGNKIYSPETCCAVPVYLNNMFSTGARGAYLLGTRPSTSKNLDTYYSTIYTGGKVKRLGTFPTMEEAHRAWQGAKIIHMQEQLDRYKTEVCYREDVHKAVQSRINLLVEDFEQGRVSTYL